VQLFSGNGGSIIPAHILQPVFDAEGTLDTAEWNQAPTVGCGPFNFAGWESGSYARFVANDNFWLGRPKLDEIFFRFVPDDAAQVAALIAGDGDLGAFIAASDLPHLEEAGIKIIVTSSGFHEGVYFNMHPEKGHPALQDAKVRQAIALGTNRQQLVHDLTLDRFGLSATLWDKTQWVEPSIAPWPYDLERAGQLLDEAGWVDSNGDGIRDKDGVELVLNYGTTNREVRQDAQTVIQQDLAQVGIQLELQSFADDIFFAGYSEGGTSNNFSLDLIEFSDSPDFPDPNKVLFLCSEIPSDENPVGSNITGLCDQELNDWLLLQATQIDLAERQATFFQISRRIFENVYWLGLWDDPDVWAINSRLLNVKISGATPFFNVMDWDLVQ
jgi:peptide/nickel transport system substrate-binding protein